MVNLPTRVLRVLVDTGHAMLCAELSDRFCGVKDPRGIPHAIESLKLAKCIAWTDQGWLPTERGRDYVRLHTRLSFERRAAG